MPIQTMSTHKPIIRSASEEEDRDDPVFGEVDEITKKIQTAAKLTSAMLDRKNPSSRKNSGRRRVRFSIDLGSMN
ncbi:unnamed protein product [Oikopleura dioica]|uniref:Uncharacterized protein n=1 Tax=Oikopleura dioica TaxID=34765 RepID=E4WR69_OIKDI|nr:unnamed protein product [Oikopleura dioica]CBY32212.1 unnamed protein product [Oikopleura dioica]